MAADPTAPTAGTALAESIDSQVPDFLARHCQGCHCGAKPKGEFALDQLGGDFADKTVRERWLSVLEQLRSGQMPPDDPAEHVHVDQLRRQHRRWFYSARLKKETNCEGETTAPLRTRDIFALNEPLSFSAVRDGTSQTIAVAEVTSNGAAARNGTKYNADLKDDLDFAADSDQPLPMTWSLRGSGTPWSPGPMLAGGSGTPRADLIATTTRATHVPMIFRAAMIALTESITGTGPCSLPETYSSAQGGTCGEASGATVVPGFELSGKIGQTPIVGIAPLYNALYSPNSNWPGPDSHHPGAIMAVYADGHSTTIQNSIDFSIWASLNTREGGETITGDY